MESAEVFDLKEFDASNSPEPAESMPGSAPGRKEEPAEETAEPVEETAA